MCYGIEMNALNFGVKRSKFKVTSLLSFDLESAPCLGSAAPTATKELASDREGHK